MQKAEELREATQEWENRPRRKRKKRRKKLPRNLLFTLLSWCSRSSRVENLDLISMAVAGFDSGYMSRRQSGSPPLFPRERGLRIRSRFFCLRCSRCSLEIWTPCAPLVWQLAVRCLDCLGSTGSGDDFEKMFAHSALSARFDSGYVYLRQSLGSLDLSPRAPCIWRSVLGVCVA